ncbi:MAG: flotillin [Candidatus Aminicenantes bacterium]|nr:flotillin [Candidatus Aminicenantes bacterium]
MDLVSTLILIAVIIIILGLTVFLIAKQYKKVGPNEVLVISGGRKKTITEPDGSTKKVGYRYRLGGGTFIWPFLETYDVLPIDIINISIKTPEVLSQGGILILADAAAQVKIKSDENSIRLAAEQFLGTGRDGIREVAQTILDGKMRAVIGTMTVEDIYRGRQEFAEGVAKSAEEEFQSMGLGLLSFALKEISDTQGYLDALGKPQIAAAKRDAAIAEAETEKDAIIKSSEARREGEVARLAADAHIAKAQWENEAKKATSQVDVNQKKAQADFSYELERVRLNREIKREEAAVKLVEKEEAIKIEDLEIKRKQKELESNVIKPADARKYQLQAEAEADSYRIQTEAKGKSEARRLEGQAEAESSRLQGLAEAETMTQKAKAWENYNQAAILELYLQKLPELAKAVAEPLSRVDKIVLVGGDKGTGATKITSQVADILAQMPEIVQSLTGVDLKKYFQDKTKTEEKDEA